MNHEYRFQLRHVRTDTHPFRGGIPGKRHAQPMPGRNQALPHGIEALTQLQEACGVGDLKMSDYGIIPGEFPTLARNARGTMGFLFACDRAPLSDADSEAIYETAYK